MNKEGLSRVLSAVSMKTGLPLSAEADFQLANQPISVRVHGLNPLETFHFKAQRSPLTWILDLSYDTFANPLINNIATRVSEHFQQVSDEIMEIEKLGLSVASNLSIFESPAKADSSFEAFKLRMISDGVAVNPQSHKNSSEERALQLLIESALRVIDLLFSFTTNNENISFPGDFEGERFLVSCGKYERSVRNRIKCLDYYGYICQACGLEPVKIYGVDGIGIIHVHHRVPLSQMTESAPLDPVKDLVPLCPNCHNFAHKRNPPFTTDEIKTILGH